MTPTSIRIRHGIVEYAITGDGPAVVALHGAMGGWEHREERGERRY